MSNARTLQIEELENEVSQIQLRLRQLRAEQSESEDRESRKQAIREREARLSKDPDELRAIALSVREGTCRDEEACRLLLSRVRLHFERQFERAQDNMRLLAEAEEAFVRGWPRVPFRVTASESSRPDHRSSAPVAEHRQTGTAQVQRVPQDDD